MTFIIIMVIVVIVVAFVIVIIIIIIMALSKPACHLFSGYLFSALFEFVCFYPLVADCWVL